MKDPDTQVIHQAMNAAVAKSFLGSSVILILMYAILAVFHLRSIPGSSGLLMSVVAAISAVMVAAIAAQYRRQKTEDYVQLYLGIIAIIVLFNCVIHFYIEAVPENTLNFGMYVIAAGLLLISRHWFYSLLFIAVVSWLGIALLSDVDAQLGQWSWFLFFAVTIAIAFHHQRRTSIYGFAKLNATHNRHARTLKELVQATEIIEANQGAMFNKILKAATQDLDVASAGIWVYDVEDEHILCVEFLNTASDLDLTGQVIHKQDGPKYFDALLNNRVIAADDANADPRTNELADYLEENSISSMLDASITVAGEMWGVICLEHRGALRTWDTLEQSYAASIADIAALTVQTTENAKLEKRSGQTKRLESLGILAGGVAHDFNNLLTVIIGQSEIVKGMSSDPNSRQSATAILEASHRAKDLAQQMLAYSGRATLLAKNHCLSEMLKEVDALWGRELAGGAILHFGNLEEKLIVNVDATQIRQVITNLLTNARDSGAQNIWLNTGVSLGKDIKQSDYFWNNPEPQGKYAWLEIQDDGAGMSESVISNIFDPFFTTRNEGTGLGLAAVLGILKAHRGAIEVESSEGQGSRFKLFLPQERSTELVDYEATRRESTERPSQRQKEVLLVEDEQLIRELTEALLKEEFERITSFGSVEDALKAISTMDLQSLSAAIIDLSLGDGNGLQIVAELERKVPSLPIVLMSGYDAQDVLSQLPKNSSVGFLHKPFTRSDLTAAVQAALTRSSQ